MSLEKSQTFSLAECLSAFPGKKPGCPFSHISDVLSPNSWAI